MDVLGVVSIVPTSARTVCWEHQARTSGKALYPLVQVRKLILREVKQFPCLGESKL